MKPIFIATIQPNENVLKFKNQSKFSEHIRSLKHADKETVVAVTVQRHRKRRSDRQNAFYWGVVVKICSEYHGYTPQEMHKSLKEHFIGMDRVEGDCLTTSKMNTEQFSTYIEEIRREYAIKCEVNIPDPDSVDYEEIEQFKY